MIDIQKAAYFKKEKNKRVRCLLCPHECLINPGQRGLCQGRINIDGLLYSDNYGKISSISMDPIEKKPLYHFYPGSQILSVGTFGCNFSCQFCQNWEISQTRPALRELEPEDLIELALKHKSMGIAYTYSEPSIWFEFVLKTSKLAKKYGLKNVLVTNGFINKEPLIELIPYLDGVNVDLKSFKNSFYEKICGGKLEPVLQNIQLLGVQKELHLELTTLIIPGYNDSVEEFRDLLNWIKEIDQDIPFHLSRYFPQYRFEKAPTSREKMEELFQVACDELNYAYLGNLKTNSGSTTYCPDCQTELLIRTGFSVKNKLEEGRCPVCQKKIRGQYY